MTQDSAKYSNHEMAKAAIQRWGELKTIRAQHEGDWEDIARLIRPQRGNFSSDIKSKRQEKPLSSEPIMAHGSFAAGIYSSITNPAMRWGGVETPDVEMNAWKPMAEWLDTATARVMASFSPSVSAFYSTTYQAYADIAAFGNAAGYDTINMGKRRFVDISLSLAEVVVDIDAYGQVSEFLRKYQLKPRALVREFGTEMVPKKIRDLAETGSTDDITLYYHVLPNDQFVKGKLGPQGKPWLAITACEEENCLLRVGGHDDMPAYFPRWDVDSGHVYGTGPGFVALGSARAADLMQRAKLKAAQFAADPTKLAPDRQAIPLNGTFRPGGVIYGGVDVRGNRLIHNMEHTPNIGLTHEERREAIEACKDAFHYSVMSLTGRTGVTEEETRIMEQARLRNWAPHSDRIMEEYAARKFERRFKLLWRAGQIPPPPPEAQGMPLRVRYQSGAAMAMKASEGQAIRSFINDLAPLAQSDPRYGDRLDPDALTEALHDASPSLPASILRSREEADQLAQARAQQQQMVQAMQLAQQGGSVAKDLAAAMGGAGGPKEAA
ncbi:MAG: hypothetical protein CML69_10830 [Rhodobacteraceae bacterium]|nr:hypothetical protein [Paracoccaceae bacterium]